MVYCNLVTKILTRRPVVKLNRIKHRNKRTNNRNNHQNQGFFACAECCPEIIIIYGSVTLFSRLVAKTFRFFAKCDPFVDVDAVQNGQARQFLQKPINESITNADIICHPR